MAQTAKAVWLCDFVNSGVPQPEHFEVVESEVNPDDAGDGDIVVEIKFMSVDPYLRAGLKRTPESGESGRRVMSGFVSGRVVASKSADWAEGDLFGASLPFQTFQIVKNVSKQVIWKLTDLLEEKNLSHGIGVLGMTGSTAYAGVTAVLRPEEGETIYVSAASGAVGSLVGQIAKNVYGVTTIGSCGSDEKIELIKSTFGYDHGINYHKVDDKEALKKELKELAPKGLNMVFENVGGFQFDACFDSLAAGGRVAICGLIAQYNNEKFEPTSLQLSQMIYTAQRIEGFVCFPWLTGQKGNFLQDMSKWLKEGKVTGVEETFYEGIDNWAVAFKSLFEKNDNKGKVVVRI